MCVCVMCVYVCCVCFGCGVRGLGLYVFCNIVSCSEFVCVGVACRKYRGTNPLCRRLSVSVTVFACFCVWVGLCVYVYCKKDVQKCVCVSV